LDLDIGSPYMNQFMLLVSLIIQNTKARQLLAVWLPVAAL